MSSKCDRPPDGDNAIQGRVRNEIAGKGLKGLNSDSPRARQFDGLLPAMDVEMETEPVAQPTKMDKAAARAANAPWVEKYRSCLLALVHWPRQGTQPRAGLV